MPSLSLTAIKNRPVVVVVVVVVVVMHGSHAEVKFSLSGKHSPFTPTAMPTPMLSSTGASLALLPTREGFSTAGHDDDDGGDDDLRRSTWACFQHGCFSEFFQVDDILKKKS